ncbi:MAG: hypothetical protein KME35_16160 [Aphanocapsa sp. GSE-SYN-MK-11-07L]|nr:hypothetical protein [Aphanocapsa sp. GSE-SYN-MK-11-07L]
MNPDEVVTLLLCVFFAGWFSYWIFSEWFYARRKNPRAHFAETIQYGKTKTTVLDFAAATRLSARRTRRFLDAKAKEFGGICDINEVGDATYYFGDSKQKLLKDKL